MTRRSRLLLAPLLAALLALAGCGTVGSMAKVAGSAVANAFDGPPSPAFLDLQALLLVMEADANLDSPLALDLVFVRDPEMLQRLQALPAARWFATREDLHRAYPEAFALRSWELVPRQALRLDEKALGSPRVAGLLLFADYRTPGDHRALLPTPARGVRVQLGARALQVYAQNR